MSISQVIEPELISYNLAADSKKDVINKLADIYKQNGIIQEKTAYVSSVLKREKDGTTGIGDGIAIPHGQSKTVKKSSVIIAKLNTPIEWHSLDDKPVSYVFLLAIPAAGDQEHLKLLSELAGLLMDDEIRRRLEKSKSKIELLNIFKEGVD
ncbi:MAG: PTS sugar transporter subunit IIA [Liquorilactobacillus nagelii]|jgi:fructose-specific phosphotransferase system IIA component|uniref:PTS mannose transporter subunit IIAB n=1 Tax=Liquorilactobacillus nagelii TaxID=82688 RepID=A0A3S6QUY3_9LACO|nr:PTS sugar transporter subunit IIA [Liquorilactobacillus nagelii]AUJ31952.1 PTS mannose transporter subunit IIAB [Liquorilactobacillus nagelii]KRL40115.1 PTS system, fructose-specific IIA component [Liquorilactobacillus nagelii DSM 13675]MCC7615093.1 PTS mannose transporter subunit IIAB [Liquorilactobacillus nagelii]MCP9314760.1 PTS sugar transporter subunit IIA [Liquorilactobacillus nagelii]QYH54106.1 PTS sugar transporter subunit IIA [Liquorilactobacillus nagelii DSM 13675]